MGARTGAQFREALAQYTPQVVVDGGVVAGVGGMDAFQGIIRTFSELYDMQHADETRAQLTFPEPMTRQRAAMSFLVPHVEEDLRARRKATEVWARYSAGMLGRTGDYLNSALTALGQAGDWFAEADPAFASNMESYTRWVRDQDLLLTHALQAPQINRQVAPSHQAGGEAAVHIVAENDSGIVVRGARMLATIAPIAQEILVFPSSIMTGSPEEQKYQVAFAAPIHAPGLRLICRRPMGSTGVIADEPLAARFDEMDCVAVFDDVHIPWERIFMLGNPAKLNSFYNATGATALMSYQAVARTVAKAEFYAGLMAETADAIDVAGFDHIREDLAQVLVAADLGKAALRAAEADSALNEFGWRQPAFEPLNAMRNYFPRAFGAFPAMMRKLGASGLMATPSEASAAAASNDIAAYLQGRSISGQDRVRLFKLAWDSSSSSFAGRQELYEQFFFGDPRRMSGAYVEAANLAELRDRVQPFLHYDAD